MSSQKQLTGWRGYVRLEFVSCLRALVLRNKVALLIGFVALLYLLTLNANWRPSWDSAIYVSLGKSLIAGRGYEYMGVPHAKYPPGFPLLLAPAIGVFGCNYFVLRLMIVMMGISSIGIVYLICRRLSDRASGGTCRRPSDSNCVSPETGRHDPTLLAETTAFSGMLLSAVSYPIVSHVTMILSDIPYMLFSFLALILIDKYNRTETCLNGTGWWTIAFLVASVFTRLAGLSLVAAAMAYLLWQGIVGFAEVPPARRMLKAGKKAVLIGVVFAAFASVWIARGRMVKDLAPPELRGGTDYEREMILVDPNAPHGQEADWGGLQLRVRRNLGCYQELIAGVVSGGTVTSDTGVKITSIILLLGFLGRAIPRPSLIEIYVPFYMCLHFLWPFREERFLVPVIPFLFLYVLSSMKLAAEAASRLFRHVLRTRRVSPSVSSRAVAFVSCGLFILNMPAACRIITEEHRKPYYRNTTADYIDAIVWVKENTPPDSVIVTDRAPWAHLLSDRKAFSFPWVRNTGEVIASMDRNGATHVIAVPRAYSKTYLSPAIRAHPNRFAEVRRMGDAVIYQFRRHDTET